MSNIFESAIRSKLRFASVKGELTTEQLWQVPLRSKDGFDLNAVAKAASKALKDLSEENFVETAKTPEQGRRELAMEVIKYVIDTKLAEEAAAKKQEENKAEKAKLLAILAEKQEGKLTALSEEELQRRIAALNS
jgi:DNA-binding MarR family transcriptional regulator